MGEIGGSIYRYALVHGLTPTTTPSEFARRLKARIDAKGTNRIRAADILSVVEELIREARDERRSNGEGNYPPVILDG